MRLTPGSSLGHYEVVEALGAGGMGEVYRGRDSRLGRDVALKVLAYEGFLEQEHIRRFEQEARAASALSHPNVCSVYDVGAHEGSPFVVMELLEGKSLRVLLQGGALGIRAAMSYAAQAADGLSAAHEKGIVHRDLKPENLFVRKDGRVVVLDFGLAKLTRQEPLSVGSLVTGTSTTPGVIVGTTGYMAPEQIRSEVVDGRADVFALGVVLFEMLTGRRPFEGLTSADVMSAILHQEAEPLTTLRPDAPLPLARLVRRCLSKDPERRVQTIKDVRNELEELLRELDLGIYGTSRTAAKTLQPVEKQFALTATHVRKLSMLSPRLIGYPLTYLDNQVESETLVLFLHGVGGDHRRFEPALRSLPYRGVAVTLAGFAPGDTYRPVLAYDDHSWLLRFLFGEIVRESRPTRTIVVGFSAGADHLLRMLASSEGMGIEVSGLVALGINVSLETCFVGGPFARMDTKNPEGILGALKSLGDEVRPLRNWLELQSYIAQTFMKFGSDLEPLQRYSAELVAPFLNGGDPLPEWYRIATQRIPSVRFVFSNLEAAPAEAVLVRHLRDNILGDQFREESFVTEPIPHGRLPEASIVTRYVESVIAELIKKQGDSRIA